MVWFYERIADLIGVVLVSWNDKQIVLGGFGSGLGSQFSWSQVLRGDVLQIQIQTVSGVTTYNTTAVPSQSIQNPASGSTGVPPVISSVSPIAATQLQTITIQGRGFGNIKPQIMNLGDGSVDTVGGGTTPVIRIYDEGSLDSWEAGVQDSPNSGADSIGVTLVSWSDTEIVLGGFGTALNTNGQGQWNISPGDQLLIAVLTTNGQAAYTTTVSSSQSSQNPPISTRAPPVISSVSPIAATQLQTITIRGSGFGNIQPQLINLTDGSVDTIVGGATPVIRIYDEAGLDSWEAGCQDSQWVPKDMIGIYLTSWSDNEIVLGGFGTELNVNGQGSSNISPGDPLIVDVMTMNGQAAFTATAVSGKSNQDSTQSPGPTSHLSTPTLNVACQSSTINSNFRVEINGNLTDNGIGIPGALISLSYSVNEGSSWQELTTVTTDSGGDFLAEWLPSVTGNYFINATYTGDITYLGATAVFTFVVTPYPSKNAQNVFSVASNSTVSDLVFNSTSGELSFTVSGASGTTGYADVYISKSLVNDISTVKACIDGNTINYTITSTVEAWILHFVYHHSTHEVTINLNNATTSKFSIMQLLQGIIYGAIISLSVIVVLLLIFRKDTTGTLSSSKNSGSELNS